MSNLVCGLYNFFIQLRISEIVESISKKKIPDHVRALVLEICCNDNDGNDMLARNNKN